MRSSHRTPEITGSMGGEATNLWQVPLVAHAFIFAIRPPQIGHMVTPVVLSCRRPQRKHCQSSTIHSVRPS